MTDTWLQMVQYDHHWAEFSCERLNKNKIKLLDKIHSYYYQDEMTVSHVRWRWRRTLFLQLTKWKFKNCRFLRSTLLYIQCVVTQSPVSHFNYNIYNYILMKFSVHMQLKSKQGFFILWDWKLCVSSFRKCFEMLWSDFFNRLSSLTSVRNTWDGFKKKKYKHGHSEPPYKPCPLFVTLTFRSEQPIILIWWET